MPRIKNYLDISILSYLIFVFLPVTRVLPTIVKIAFEASALIFLLLYDMRQKNLFLKDVLMMVGIVVADLIIFFGIWRDTGVEILSKNLMLFLFWTPLLYLENLKQLDEKRKENIILTIENLINLTAVTTVIGNIRYPYASRQLASTIDMVSNRMYQGLNIGGYGFIYALVLLLPFIFYRFKKTHRKKYIVMFVLYEIAIIFSAYMTAILLSVIAIFISLIVVSSFRRHVIVIVIAVSTLLAVLRSQIAVLLNNIYTFLLAGNLLILAERVENLYRLLSNGELVGDAGYRNELYEMSIEAFQRSPVMGKLTGGTSTLGLHAEFLDLLGGIGIFGITILILILLPRIKAYTKQIKKTDCVQYCLISTSILVIIGFINTITTAPEIASVFFLTYTCASSRYVIISDQKIWER